MKAWSGVDIIYKYLIRLADNGQLEVLLEDIPEEGEEDEGATISIDPNLTALLLRKIEFGSHTHLYAKVIGTSGAEGTRAKATSTIEAVYLITQESGGPGSSSPGTSTIFRGGVSITGGTTEFISGVDLADIAVQGNMTLGSAAKAGVAGCATGNITMSGGGIKDNATLYAGGDFTVSSMSEPNKATVWAQNITIGNTGSANYTALKAGAYAADVFDGSGVKIGSALVGGKLITGTTDATIPWRTGTIVPFTDHKFVIQLDNSGQLLIDLSEAAIDSNTGLITGYKIETLSDCPQEDDSCSPSALQFKATGIAGGNLSIHTLTVGRLWGHSVSINGYGGNYTEALVNGNFTAGTGTIGVLTGGGNMHAVLGGCSGSTNCWNTPTFANTSNIAGTLSVGSYTGAVTLSKLNTQVANTSPGLPGAPYCDTRVNEIDAESYKLQANYIFEYVNNKPQLTVRNVTLANGTPLDGVYILSDATTDVRRLGGEHFLACNWYSDHCFRNPTPGTWHFTGIYAFPPGVAWFDGPVTIDGVDSNNAVPGMGKDILATLISAGGVTLTQSGHGQLVAPNFNPTALCQGKIRPTNLCTASGELVTWTDPETNTTYDGLPLGNAAVLAEGQLDIRGWTVHGHVVLGRGMVTAANQSVIYGRLIVGANQITNTSISEGGFKIITDTLSGSQLHMPGETNGGGPGQLEVKKVLWTRYL